MQDKVSLNGSLVVVDYDIKPGHTIRVQKVCLADSGIQLTFNNDDRMRIERSLYTRRKRRWKFQSHLKRMAS